MTHRSTAVFDTRLSAAPQAALAHRWVDPALCRIWIGHNRDAGLLTVENCRDLIDGIRAQGKQEFPAVVRPAPKNSGFAYEVICGARRHFAITWLRANHDPKMHYLIAVRDLTDEAAFCLADLENRHRTDISDYERARDYALALDRYFDGRQRSMAKRLHVSEVWLSRHLDLARLHTAIVLSFATIHDIREIHARTLKPLMKHPEAQQRVIDAAHELQSQQAAARDGACPPISAAKVMARLKAAAQSKPRAAPARFYTGGKGQGWITHRPLRKTHRLDIPKSIPRDQLEAALAAFLEAEY